MRENQIRLGYHSRGNQVCSNFLVDELRVFAKYFSKLSDLGNGNNADTIYHALEDCWGVALSSGAKVLAMTVPECAVEHESLDANRNILNSHILKCESEEL